MNLETNGLYKLVSQEMDLPPLSGAVFIFFSKNRQQVKLLRWDTDGFTLYHATNSSPCASSRRYTMWGRFRCQGYRTPYQLPLPQEPQASRKPHNTLYISVLSPNAQNSRISHQRFCCALNEEY